MLFLYNENMLISSKFTYPQLDVCLFEQLDSTNNYAKQTEFKKDTLIIADYQTAGRGRFQRHFYSPKGKGLYFTLVLHQLLFPLNLYTLIMAISVSYVIPDSTIKWLNDILIDTKKVCGILCETVVENTQVKKIIIGVGINLFESKKPPVLQDVMTSLNDKQLNVEQFLSRILDNFYQLLTLSQDQIIALYKAKCETINKDIVINNHKYRTIDIAPQGYLVCIDANGQTVILKNAELSLQSQELF